jgi:monoamine oxidase
MEKFDVVIIGAGASGLMAAKILCEAKKNVCVLEGRDRIGGRVHTFLKTGFTKPIEGGGEFIHGNLDLTLGLLKEAGLQFHKTGGELWQVKNNKLIRRTDFIEHADQLMKKLKELDHDMSVAELLKKYFDNVKYSAMKISLQQYMEGYDAADIQYASALALKEEWEKGDDDQYKIEGGYGPLLDHLKNNCLQNGCSIHLNVIAKKIKWKDGEVEIITSENKIFIASKVIITVPLPFLTGEQNEAGISFEPSLPVINDAAKQIGYGGVIKIILEFTHAFWETGDKKVDGLFFLFSEEKIPTWWTQLPDKTPILTGWLAGPKSNIVAKEDDDSILHQALLSLSNIFEIDIKTLQQNLKGSHVHNWNKDPFSMGAYSYNSITTVAAKKILSTPISNTLFFAGEALDKNFSATVDAALQSGKDVAEKVLKIL